MSVIQMTQRIKQIHPEYVIIYKVGAFCNTFGKDSYIISSIFNYELKSTKIKVIDFLLNLSFDKEMITSKKYLKLANKIDDKVC